VARSITVYRSREDLERHNAAVPPKGATREEVDAWLAACIAETPFDAPLGSESAIRLYWSDPAAALNLPRFAAIYERGFQEGIFWLTDDFEGVLQELEQLEQHWQQMKLSDDMVRNLRVRAGHIREAIRIAGEMDGLIVIG
jgi:hypothetical protein